MAATQFNDAATAAQSFVDWWKLAGVDYLVEDEPIDWLAEAPVAAVKVANPAPKTPISAAVAAPVAAPRALWPDTLEALTSALHTDRSLPGNGHGIVSALPVGQAQANYMIIADFPEQCELAAGEMGALPLLRNMLQAAGIPLDNCYFAALAYSRPATGALREADKIVLGEFIQHQIALVAPKKIILLGNSASEILLGTDLMQARGNLGIINHIVGSMTAFVTFHPRTLAAQPILKAKAWADLQMVMQETARDFS
jgi:uracil-DNA glycosylase